MARTIDVAELISNPPFELSKADKEVLIMTDEDFVPHTWDELRVIIDGGDTSLLKRSPTDLRNYILWTRKIRRTFGSATNFVLQNRLQWKPETKNSEVCFPCRDQIPFRNASDYRVLRNDWPYALSLGTVHLVVWSKTPIRVDEDGNPTPGSRRLIEEFIERTFAEEMGHAKHAGNNIQWFRNRTKWQSMRALEHIHIILRDVDGNFVTRLTGQSAHDVECKLFTPSVD